MRYFSTGNIKKPNREPDFKLYNRENNAMASYWVVDVIDDKNIKLLYRYDNGKWRVNRCSTMHMVDGKLFFRHNDRGFHEYKADHPLHEHVLKAVREWFLTTIIEGIILGDLDA